MGLFRIGNKKAVRLSVDEQKEIMTQISAADDVSKVQELFAKLYDSMVHAHWSVLSKKYIPPLDHEELKDIFQEAWIKVLENRDRYDGKSKVYNWIYIIKKNLIIDSIRKNKKMDRNYNKINGEEEDYIYTPWDKNDDPMIDEEIISKETLYIILETIDKIEDVTEKSIIEMRIVRGMKYDDISNTLNIPLTTVHYKANKALDKLRERLGYLLNS
ncbi:MAG: RNA polymerase sigma factor [Candidatus Kapaibacterium sp.]